MLRDNISDAIAAVSLTARRADYSITVLTAMSNCNDSTPVSGDIIARLNLGEF